MKTFQLKNLANDLNSYLSKNRFLSKAYMYRDNGLITLYFFTEKVEKFPEDSYEFEKKLEKSYPNYSFDIKIIPYKPKVAEQYAEDYHLTPVLE